MGRMISRTARPEWEKIAGTQLCFLQMQTDLCKHVCRFLRTHIWVGTCIHCFVSGQQGSEPSAGFPVSASSTRAQDTLESEHDQVHSQGTKHTARI